MTRLIEILISFAIVAVLMLVIGVVLPSSRSLSQSVETNRKMTIVYDTLNSLRRFKEWNTISLRAPKAETTLSGPVSGVGATFSYKSDAPQVLNGSWKIVESVPGKSIKYALENDFRGTNKTMLFTFTPTGRGNVKRNIQITQTYSVDYGWDLIGRYAGMYIKSHVGDDMKVSLNRFNTMLATVPNVDYAVKGSKMRGMAEVDRPAEDLLVVKAGAIDRNNDTIKASMKSNLEWINRTMAANGLVAAGPLRIVTTELGRETYTFDLSQPVRKAGNGEKTPEAADPSKPKEKLAPTEEVAAADAADAAAAPVADTLAPVAAAGAPMTVTIPAGAPVQYMQSKPTRAAVAYFTGYMAELDNVRNALRAWAVTQGAQVVDRPYEVYKSGIDKAFPQAGATEGTAEFEVYWTLKDENAPTTPATAAAAAATPAPPAQ